MALSACRTSNTSIYPFYGSSWPKSCECYKQIVAYAYDPARKAGYLNTIDGLKDGRVKYCYRRPHLPLELYLSDPPRVKAPGWHWMKPRINDAGDLIEEFLLTPLEHHTFGSHHALPLDMCKDRCNDRGACTGTRRPGHCMCMRGFAGDACEKVDPEACLNRCSGNGECQAGFCKCKEGFWGMDCSRSKAYEPDPNKALEVNGSAYERTRLRIYRYEMPWYAAFQLNTDDLHEDYDKLYSAFELFYNQFSHDWTVHTENPHEANLFYIPLLEYFRDHNAGNNMEYTRRAVHYVKDTYPQFWNRNQGKDHFFWLPGDLGACWLYDEPELQNPIKVVHWGLQINASLYTSMPNYHWHPKHPTNKEYSCFKFEKDVVTPCWVDQNHQLFTQRTVELVYKQALDNEKRRYLLYFGGSIRPTQFEYSGGARQSYHKHVIEKKHPGVIFSGGSEKYKESTFCFAPYGDGWGARLMQIMMTGCIPVIIQDYVHQPFDDVLPYLEFSIRLRVADIPALLDILQAISQEQIQQYRQSMYKWWHAFGWIPEQGGEAYNYTLKSLHKKLYNLWGVHYRRTRSLARSRSSARLLRQMVETYYPPPEL